MPAVVCFDCQSGDLAAQPVSSETVCQLGTWCVLRASEACLGVCVRLCCCCCCD